MARKPGGNAARPTAKPTAPRAKRSAPKRAPKVIDLDATAVKPKQPAKTPPAKTPPQKTAPKPTAAKGTASQQAATKAAAGKKTGTSQTRPPHRPEPPMPKAASASKTKSTVAAKNAPPKTAPPPKPAQATTKSSSGFGALLAAALIGGVVALGGAWILGAFEAGSRTAGAASDAAALEQRITQLEETEPVEGVDEETVAALVDARLANVGNTEVAANVSARLTDLENQSQANGDELSALSERLSERLADRLANFTAEGDGASAAEITALQNRIAELEDAPAPRNEETIAAIDDLSTRSDILAEQVSEAASTGEAVGEQLAALTGQIEDLAAELETVRQATADAEGKATTAGALAQATMEEVMKAVVDLDASTETRIAALNDRIENGADKLAARALAAAALKRDIDRGDPFADSLATLEGLVDDPAGLQRLAPFSESGVQSAAKLTLQFQTLANDILAATAPTSEAGSLTERLLAGARNAVQLRTDGSSDADGPAATIAAIEAALSDGRLKDASDQWEELPEKGRVVSIGWHDALLARIEANALVANSVDAFLQRQAGE